MRIPAFLGAPRALAIPAAAMMARAPVGGAAASSVALHMQTQAQTNWCWAATAASVSVFYNSASAWTQCGVAAQCLPGSLSCCANAASCNLQWQLDDALSATGNMRGNIVPGSLPPVDIDNELQGNHPIGCYVDWAGNGGHFCAITGFDASTSDVYVADPKYGAWTGPLNSFTSGGYQHSGSWTFTYLTQP